MIVVQIIGLEGLVNLLREAAGQQPFRKRIGKVEKIPGATNKQTIKRG